MSLPRRAMKELGLQACCLRCDEEDVTGSTRCKSCIAHHRELREVLAKAPADDPLYQFAKELLLMAAAPHRYDHDPVHGSALIEQQRMAAALSAPTPLPSSEEIGDLFASQKATQKTSLIQDIANHNLWKDSAPSPEVANQIGKEAWDEAYVESTTYTGSRTIPSKPIAPSDRSDRIGEDVELSDRLNAAAEASSAPEELSEILENEGVERRKQARKDWKEAVGEIQDLIDDDLDI